MEDSPALILEKGIDSWNRWRAERSPAPCSLAGQDLGCGYYFEGNFSNVDLRGANLQRACLIGANFKNADLSDVNFTEAYVDRANFEGAILTGANFTGTDLSRTDLLQSVIQLPTEAQYDSDEPTAPEASESYPKLTLSDEGVSDAQSEGRSSAYNRKRFKPLAVWLSGAVAGLAIALPTILSAHSPQSLSSVAAPERAKAVETTTATVKPLPSPQLPARPPARWAEKSKTNLALVKSLITSGQVWSVEAYTRDDGHILVMGGNDEGDINIWDGPTGEVLHVLAGHRDTVRDLEMSSSGQRLVSASGDGIKVWQPQTGELLYSLPAESNAPVWSVAISPDGQTFVSGDYAGNVVAWDMASGEQLYKIRLQKPVWSVAIAPDGQSFVSGGSDRLIHQWALASGELIQSFSGHKDAVRSVAISPDGSTLASGSWDSTIGLWDLQRGELSATLSGHRDRVVSIAISPDGNTLASSSVDSTLKMWDIPSQELTETLDNSDSWVLSVAFDPTEQTLVSGGKTPEIKLWQ